MEESGVTLTQRRGVKGQSDGGGGKGAGVQDRKHAEEGDKDADRAGRREGCERSREHERGKDISGAAGTDLGGRAAASRGAGGGVA